MKTISLGFGALCIAQVACNLSTTVGQNEGGAGGRDATDAAGPTTSNGPAGPGPAGPTGQTGSGTTTNSSTVASTTQAASSAEGPATTAAVTSGGGSLQNAHVVVRVGSSHTWLGEHRTGVSIVALPGAPDPLPSLAPCAQMDVPASFFDPSVYLPLDGVEGIVASGGSSAPLFYDEDFRSASALFAQPLASGSKVTVTFGASSSLWPGQVVELTVRDGMITSPALTQVGQSATIIVHPTGQDMTISVNGDSLPYQVSALATGGDPLNPALRPVISCQSPAQSSTMIPFAMWSPVIDFVNSINQSGQGPSEAWMGVTWRDRQLTEQALLGNFLTTEANALFAVPVSFQ